MQYRSRSRSEAAGDGQRQRERHQLVLPEGGDSAAGCNAQSAAFRIGDCSSTLNRNSDRAMAGDSSSVQAQSRKSAIAERWLWCFVIETSWDELNN